MDHIGYTSPSESSIEFEGKLTRGQEKLKDVPQWKNEVLGRVHDVKE